MTMTMTHAPADLRTPNAEVRASFAAAADEFTCEGRDPWDLARLNLDPDVDHGESPTTFTAFVAAVRSEADPNVVRVDGWVPQTTLWWTQGAQFYGRLSIRHQLNADLLQVGGHIGYAVRPSARRQGHATAMLHAGLTVARELGIGSALLTCDVTNPASRRVIETNGGVLEDQRGVKMRFWVPTLPKPATLARSFRHRGSRPVVSAQQTTSATPVALAGPTVESSSPNRPGVGDCPHPPGQTGDEDRHRAFHSHGQHEVHVIARLFAAGDLSAVAAGRLLRRAAAVVTSGLGGRAAQCGEVGCGTDPMRCGQVGRHTAPGQSQRGDDDHDPDHEHRPAAPLV